VKRCTRSSAGLAKVERHWFDIDASETDEWARALDALADLCRVARELDVLQGLAPPAPALEPESLPARLLAEIDRGHESATQTLRTFSARTPGR